MARLAYYAPGVYVEEIASARQPIAGVGTNTVGFIGIVPDVVYLPVSNPDYDPVLARGLLDLARIAAEAPERDAGAELERQKFLEDMQGRLSGRLTVMDAEIAELDTAIKKLTTDATTAGTDLAAAQKARTDLAPAASEQDKAKALTALNAAQKKSAKASGDLAEAMAALATKQFDRDNISTQFEAAKSAPAAAPAAPAAAGAPAPAPKPEADDDAVETEVEDYSGEPLAKDSHLLERSVLRPYYLKAFTVRADLLATKLCTNFTEYVDLFGNFSAFMRADDGSFAPISPGHHLLTHALAGFFDNGGTRAFVARISGVDQLKDVLDRFQSIEDVALLAAPGLPKTIDTWEMLETYCESEARQNVFAILDSPAVINDGKRPDLAVDKLQFESLDRALPRKSTHAAYYFPHIEVSDAAKQLQDTDPAWGVPAKYRGRTYVAPSGHMAGIYARTDEERGVHKAPANAVVRGALEVKYYVSKPKQEMLNPQGVNCIRLMNGDVTVWGARTIGGDRNGDSKFISVRRFLGFLEASLDRGTQWVVFEPNDPKLWSKIILNVTAFLTNVWRSGALFGLTENEAFYVKCDAELNPPEVRDLGQVVTEIGVSIVRPAEFVIFRISQSAGQQQS